MNKPRRIHYWLQERSFLIISILIIIVSILIVWFITVGSSNNENFVIWVAVISAFFAAISAIANLLSAFETQKERVNSERPYVYGYFDTKNSRMIYFVIQNFGNSPAFDISIDFEIAPIDYAQRSLGEISLFSKPISFMAPSQMYVNLVNSGPALLGSDNIKKYSYTINYYSFNRERYTEKIEIDLSFLADLTLQENVVEKEIISIRRDFDKISTDLNRLKGIHSDIAEKLNKKSLRPGKLTLEDSYTKRK